jgi:transposase
MIKNLSGDKDTLTKWMGAVDADLPVLRSFTAGLRRDLDAVVAGHTLKYNSGAVEAPSTASNNSRRRCTAARNPTFSASSYFWHETPRPERGQCYVSVKHAT